MATELKNRNTDEAVGAAPVESAAGNPDAAEPVAARSATAEPSAAETTEKVAAPNDSEVLDGDEAEIADKYDEAYYLNMHNFTVSPEEYDRIVAICLEPPGPVSEGMLDLIRAAKKWGFV